MDASQIPTALEPMAGSQIAVALYVFRLWEAHFLLRSSCFWAQIKHIYSLICWQLNRENWGAAMCRTAHVRARGATICRFGVEPKQNSLKPIVVAQGRFRFLRHCLCIYLAASEFSCWRFGHWWTSVRRRLISGRACSSEIVWSRSFAYICICSENSSTKKPRDRTPSWVHLIK
jgi:hypothetical protein